MTPYFLADVYFGFEPAARCGLPAVRARPLFTASGLQRRAWCGVAGRSNATRITEPQIAEAAAAAAQLPAYTKLYVQVNVFASFVQRLLPRIQTPLILMTGQYSMPALKGSGKERALFDAVLAHPNIVRWWSQNPVQLPARTPNPHKYRGIPYGIKHSELSPYAKCHAEAHAGPPNKTAELLYAPFALHGARDVTDTRSKLATLPQYAGTHLPNGNLVAPMPYRQYCRRIAQARFVLSPPGDRFECYRHLEAIGAGAVPICDCPAPYAQLFSGWMLLARNSTELVDWARSPSLLRAHLNDQTRQLRAITPYDMKPPGPNRDVRNIKTWSMKEAYRLVMVETWRARVDADLPPPSPPAVPPRRARRRRRRARRSRRAHRRRRPRRRRPSPPFRRRRRRARAAAAAAAVSAAADAVHRVARGARRAARRRRPNRLLGRARRALAGHSRENRRASGAGGGASVFEVICA